MMPVRTDELATLHRNGGEDENSEFATEYKSRYRELKRKLKALLFEQECYQDELQKAQRKLLKVNRDKSFLLDRLLQYESVELSSSDEERTASSSEEDQDFEQDYWERGAPIVKPVTENRIKKKVPATSTSQATQSKGASKGIKKQAAEVGEKARCKHTDNGKQCTKLVSKRIKSGYCFTHRTQLKAEKQASRQSKENASNAEKSNDQIPDDPRYFNYPNPMISGGISSDLAHNNSLTEHVYNISTNLSAGPASGSPSSGTFPTNMYEGDDDLVIDLPE